MSSRTRWALLIIVAILAYLAVAVFLVPILSSTASVITFTCDYTHSLADDPIVFPNQPGASHLHDFFGNPSTNADSSAQSLAGVPDRCTAAGDHSGYWAPATYVNGARAVPSKMGAYWRDAGIPNLEPAPFGMQYVAGDAHATSPQPHIGWACTNGKETPAPRDCTSTHKGVTVRITFANCWDGIDVQRSDFDYSSAGTCPAGFTHAIPQLIVIMQPRNPDGSRMHNPLNADGSVAISFASGAYYTVHADFLNAFDPAAMQAITDGLNA